MNFTDFLQLFRALTSSIPCSCECFLSFSLCLVYLTTFFLATIIVLKGTVTTTNATPNATNRARDSSRVPTLFYFIFFLFVLLISFYNQLAYVYAHPNTPFPPPRRITFSTNASRHITPSPSLGMDATGMAGSQGQVDTISQKNFK